MTSILKIAALAACLVLAQGAWATLPKPQLTPEQAQAAAAKKAEADAKAAKEKEQLAASMDAVSARWRAQAASHGWKLNPPTAIAQAPAPAVGASAVTPANAGIPAPAPAGAAPGTAAAAPATGAAPLSPQAIGSANVPVKSEKLGTAAPSKDVKTRPTQSVPQGASPAVDRGNSDAVKNR